MNIYKHESSSLYKRAHFLDSFIVFVINLCYQLISKLEDICILYRDPLLYQPNPLGPDF